MKDKTMELLEYINADDMRRFEEAAPKRKAQLIIKNFQNYKMNQTKFAKAKTQEEKDAFSIHIERFWMLANKQVKSLSDEEMAIYLSAVKERVVKVIENPNDEKLLDNKLFFGTILRQLPTEMSADNMSSKGNIQELLSSLDYTFEK